MNKKITSFIMIIMLIATILFIILCSKEVIESVAFSISIWKDNLFPTLFPFFVISNLLMSYGFVEIIGKLLSNPMQKYFKLPGECGFVLATSLFSGFPSGAKYTKDLVKRKIISNTDGSRLLTFTHYSNPLFILGMIGSILLHNKGIALLILISHITSGILVGIIFSRKYKNKEQKTKLSLKSIFNNYTSPTKSFGELLTSSIFDSLNTMFLLLGIVTIFLIITTIINEILKFPPFIHAVVSGILEMTQGIKLVSSLNCTILIKTVLMTGIISFGGISVHTQVLGIISDEKIKYKPFLIARIMHSLLSMMLVSILYLVLIN